MLWRLAPVAAGLTSAVLSNDHGTGLQVGALVGGWLLAEAMRAVEARARDVSFVLVMAPVSVGGMFLCLPDTERVLVLLAATCALAAVALALRQARPRVALTPFFAIAVTVVAVDGARGRHSTLVPALACFGLGWVAFVTATRIPVTPITFVVHGAVVFAIARGPGLERDRALAAAGSFAVLALVVAGTMAVATRADVIARATRRGIGPP